MRFNLDSSTLPGEVVPKAAPRPVLRLLDQPTYNGIAVHVSKLFDALVAGMHVEVVVARLPELLALALQELGRLCLQDVQRHGERMQFRLGDEKMNMLGHQDVSEDPELVPPAQAFEFLFKDNA
jgi:hypothetical protein